MEVTKPEHKERKRCCKDCGKPVVPTSYWFCGRHAKKTKDWDETENAYKFHERVGAKKKAMS